MFGHTAMEWRPRPCWTCYHVRVGSRMHRYVAGGVSKVASTERGSVVVKASELSPLTHTMIVDIYRQAGLDKYPGAINSLSVDRKDAAEVTEKLIAHPYIRKIEFIGR